MEHTIAAPARRRGRERCGYAVGDLVEEGAELITLRDRGARAPDAGSARMPLHLMKLAVGIDDIDASAPGAGRAARRSAAASWVYTRNHPRRAEAVLAGGSLYWVIRGRIRVRQRVAGFRSERDENGRALLPDRGRSRGWCRPCRGRAGRSRAGAIWRRTRRRPTAPDGRRAAAARSHAGRAARAGPDLRRCIGNLAGWRPLGRSRRSGQL